jgi:chromosome segregation ATPase
VTIERDFETVRDRLHIGKSAWMDTTPSNGLLFDEADDALSRIEAAHEEARGGHEMAADSVVKLRHELVTSEAERDALKAEVERLRKRNNDSNYHQNQKDKDIVELKGLLTIEKQKVAQLRMEREELRRSKTALTERSTRSEAEVEAATGSRGRGLNTASAGAVSCREAREEVGFVNG